MGDETHKTDPPLSAYHPGDENGAAQRQLVFALIGQLSVSWSNTESLFIHVLHHLLGVDFTGAAITFVTLNTTRARMDLIRRLTHAQISDQHLAARITKLIERFNRCTKTRNEFNHCIYQIDKTGEITHTDILKIVETKGKMSIATQRPFDAQRRKQIANTITRLNALNSDLWEILPELKAYVKAPPHQS